MPRAHVLYFSGGVNDFANYARYRADIQLLGRVLRGVKLFSQARYRVLLAAGGENLDLGIPVSSELATRESFASVMDDAANTIAADDLFCFVATNHGGLKADLAVSYLWCWARGTVEPSELSSWLNRVRAARQLIVLGQCYSGGFVQPLARPGRCIMTASAWDQPSWASQDGRYDEFLLRIAEGLTAQIAKPSELFKFARAADTRPEHPQFFSGGLGETLDFNSNI